MTTRSPLKIVGGKSASAERIVSLFPDPALYDTYCEPCGGAGHVLFQKADYGHREVYNDLDGNLCAFWLELQSNGSELAERLKRLPNARQLYYEYYRSLFDGTMLTQSERALRFFYALRFTGTGWLRKSPVGWNNLQSNAVAYRNTLELFEAMQERLQYVLIDNRDVLATIKRYDSPRTLFYVDTPYLGAEMYYETSKNGFDHEGVARLLQSVQGHVAFSCYPHDRLEEWYPVEKWRRVTWQQYKTSQIQQCDTLERATELLLCNYPDEAQPQLWEAA